MAKKAIGLLALLGALAFMMKGDGQNNVPNPNPNPNPNPDPGPEPPVLLTPLIITLPSGQNLNFLPFNYSPPTGGQVYGNTSWDITQVIGYDGLVAAINQDPDFWNHAYRTGWALLFDLESGSTVQDATAGIGIFQIVLFNNGFTPQGLYTQGKDAITVLGQIFGQQISPPAPSITNVNWASPQDEIKSFVTGFQFLNPAGLQNFQTHFWHTSEALDQLYLMRLTIPMGLKAQNAWIDNANSGFNSSFPH